MADPPLDRIERDRITSAVSRESSKSILQGNGGLSPENLQIRLLCQCQSLKPLNSLRIVHGRFINAGPPGELLGAPRGAAGRPRRRSPAHVRAR